MKALLNAMAISAQRASEDTHTGRVGIVDAYDPNTYSVKVRIQPSDVLSGWIPIASCYVGNGWGMQVGPNIGDAMLITHQEGDIDAGMAHAGMFNDQDRPLPVPSGEFWLVHKSGSFLKFLNNGDVSAHANRDLIVDAGRDVIATVARNLSATIGGNATATVTGNFSATVTGYAHITSSVEITYSAPIISLISPIINLTGTLVQTAGAGTGTSTMQGPLTVQNEIHSNTEVTAQTTPLHTHTHTDPQGGNTGAPTP